MLIYLASRYSRYPEMQQVRADLEAVGHTVTSRWIEGNHRIDGNGLSEDAKQGERTRFAVEDLDDLLKAECIVSFTELPKSAVMRGGRHEELGIGIGTKKKCVVIGPRENVFHCLPIIEWYPDYQAFARVFLNRSLQLVCDCGFEYSISKDENPAKIASHKVCICGQTMKEVAA